MRLGAGIVNLDLATPTYSQAAAYAAAEDQEGFFRWLISMSTSCDGEDMDLNDVMDDYIKERKREIISWIWRSRP